MNTNIEFAKYIMPIKLTQEQIDIISGCEDDDAVASYLEVWMEENGRCLYCRYYKSCRNDNKFETCADFLYEKLIRFKRKVLSSNGKI